MFSRKEHAMITNTTTLDRRLRVLLVAPAAVVAGALVGPVSAVSIVLYAIAAIMLATGVAGYCPLYSVFRLGRGRALPH
jgi:Inner membrane protein YgaP-like, transmembrane domain